MTRRRKWATFWQLGGTYSTVLPCRTENAVWSSLYILQWGTKWKHSDAVHNQLLSIPLSSLVMPLSSAHLPFLLLLRNTVQHLAKSELFGFYAYSRVLEVPCSNNNSYSLSEKALSSLLKIFFILKSICRLVCLGCFFCCWYLVVHDLLSKRNLYHRCLEFQ